MSALFVARVLVEVISKKMDATSRLAERIAPHIDEWTSRAIDRAMSEARIECGGVCAMILAALQERNESLASVARLLRMAIGICADCDTLMFDVSFANGNARILSASRGGSSQNPLVRTVIRDEYTRVDNFSYTLNIAVRAIEYEACENIDIPSIASSARHRW